MGFQVKVPARINILGNPSDANEGAHQTISAAINLFGELICEEGDDTIEFNLLSRDGYGKYVLDKTEKRPPSELDYTGDFQLQLAGIRILLKYSEEFREKFIAPFPRMTFCSEIPRQSGLGGSTVLVHLTLVGMVHYYKLDKKRHNLYFLAELAQRAEEKELGITCGFADRYVPLLGDLAYIDYRGKLFHLELKEEPYVTYEKLGPFIDYPSFVVIYSGFEHSSGDVHKPMRARYLEEYRSFKGDYDSAPFMVRQMKLIGDTAWKGKIAILESDWERFGELMNENHRLVNEMMEYCGYEAGAGLVNNQIIELARNLGVLGAKLTGAGGGGSVFVLTRPGEEGRIRDEIEKELQRLSYKDATVWIPSIARRGVVILDGRL